MAVRVYHVRLGLKFNLPEHDHRSEKGVDLATRVLRGFADGKKNEPVYDLWVAVVGKYVIWWKGKIEKKNDVPQETLMLLLLGIDLKCL